LSFYNLIQIIFTEYHIFKHHTKIKACIKEEIMGGGTKERNREIRQKSIENENGN
jgi:hypothetical protein